MCIESLGIELLPLAYTQFSVFMCRLHTKKMALFLLVYIIILSNNVKLYALQYVVACFLQASWQTPAYTPTQPVGTPIQTPSRTPHYMTTPQGPPQGSFGRGRGGGGNQHKGGRGGGAPWKQSSGSSRRSHNRQRQ